MRSQRCTQCGTRLDVSRMEEGAKFTCSNCSAVLVVGDVPVTKKSLADKGPQFTPRSKKSEATGPAPKRGRPRPPKADDGGKPARSRRPRDRAPAADSGGKSKMPLFAGIGVIAVAGIVIAVMSAGGGGPGGGSGPTPQAKWWTSTQAMLDSADAASLRAAIDEAKQKGYDQNPAFWDPKADALYKALLKLAPDDEQANRFYGRRALQSRKGFADDWAGLETHVRRMPEEYVRFYETHLEAVSKDAKIWMSDEEFQRADRILGAFGAWRKEAEADPTPALVEKGRMRAQALTAGFGELPVAELPVIVFLGSRELSDDAEKAIRDAKTATLGPRIATVKKRVQAVKKAWTEQIAQPLGLPGFTNDKAFYVYCLDSREAFDQLAAREGRGMELDVGSQLLFFWRTADPAAFGLMPATPEEDKWFSDDLGHILVHMFQKEFSHDPKDKYGDPMKDWNGLWLTEGLAEYIGSGCHEDGSFDGVSEKRKDFLRQADTAGVLLYSIRDIVRFTSYPTYVRYFGDAYVPEVHADKNAPETVSAFYQSLGGMPFYARPAMQSQCWYLCYFLNHFENGKYKSNFQQLVKSMLQGRRDPATGERFGSSEDAFAAAMGLKTQADWDKLQREYDDYLPKAVGSG